MNLVASAEGGIGLPQLVQVAMVIDVAFSVTRIIPIARVL